jgi:hypothetical protein
MRGYVIVTKYVLNEVVGTLNLMPKEDQSTIEYTSKGYEAYAPFVIQSD